MGGPCLAHWFDEVGVEEFMKQYLGLFFLFLFSFQTVTWQAAVTPPLIWCPVLPAHQIVEEGEEAGLAMTTAQRSLVTLKTYHGVPWAMTSRYNVAREECVVVMFFTSILTAEMNQYHAWLPVLTRSRLQMISAVVLCFVNGRITMKFLLLFFWKANLKKPF